MYSSISALKAGTGDKEYFPSKTDTYDAHKRVIPCKTLTSIVNDHSIKKAILCSIDVEGFELDVLQGFDFQSCQIFCFIIENNSSAINGSPKVREILKDNGY